MTRPVSGAPLASALARARHNVETDSWNLDVVEAYVETEHPRDRLGRWRKKDVASAIEKIASWEDAIEFMRAWQTPDHFSDLKVGDRVDTYGRALTVKSIDDVGNVTTSDGTIYPPSARTRRLDEGEAPTTFVSFVDKYENAGETVDGETARQITRAVVDMVKRYPVLTMPGPAPRAPLGAIDQSVNISEFDPLALVARPGIWAFTTLVHPMGYAHPQSAIYLNNNADHEGHGLNQRTVDAARNGTLASSDLTPYGLMVHELGHAYRDALGLRRPGVRAMLDDVGLTPREVRHFSKYGASSPDEAWGEIFSLVNVGGLDQISKRTRRKIDALMAKIQDRATWIMEHPDEAPPQAHFVGFPHLGGWTIAVAGPSLDEALRQAEENITADAWPEAIEEAYREELHPRDRHGRWIHKRALEALLRPETTIGTLRPGERFWHAGGQFTVAGPVRTRRGSPLPKMIRATGESSRAFPSGVPIEVRSDQRVRRVTGRDDWRARLKGLAPGMSKTWGEIKVTRSFAGDYAVRTPGGMRTGTTLHGALDNVMRNAGYDRGNAWADHLVGRGRTPDAAGMLPELRSGEKLSSRGVSVEHLLDRAYPYLVTLPDSTTQRVATTDAAADVAARHEGNAPGDEQTFDDFEVSEPPPPEFATEHDGDPAFEDKVNAWVRQASVDGFAEDEGVTIVKETDGTWSAAGKGAEKGFGSLQDAARYAVSLSYDERKSRDEEVQQFADIFDGFQHGGLDINIDSAAPTGVGSAEVKGTINDEDGRAVGEIQRSIYNGIVEHDLLVLDEDVRNRGFATALMLHQLDAYEKLGYKRVNIHASLSTGGFAWATLGFEWDHPDVAQSWLAPRLDGPRLADAVAVADRADVDKLRTMLKAHAFEHPWEVAQFGHEHPFKLGDPPRTTWIGKEVLLGSDWHGHIDLTDEAQVEDVGRRIEAKVKKGK